MGSQNRLANGYWTDQSRRITGVIGGGIRGNWGCGLVWLGVWGCWMSVLRTWNGRGDVMRLRAPAAATARRPPPVVHRPSSTARRQPPVVNRPSSTARRPPPSLKDAVQGADRAHPPLVEDMGVNHGGANICVAKEFLDRADIRT